MSKYVNKDEILKTIRICMDKEEKQGYINSAHYALRYLYGLIWTMDSIDINDGERKLI